MALPRVLDIRAAPFYQTSQSLVDKSPILGLGGFDAGFACG